MIMYVVIMHANNNSCPDINYQSHWNKNWLIFWATRRFFVLSLQHLLLENACTFAFLLTFPLIHLWVPLYVRVLEILTTFFSWTQNRCRWGYYSCAKLSKITSAIYQRAQKTLAHSLQHPFFQLFVQNLWTLLRSVKRHFSSCRSSQTVWAVLSFNTCCMAPSRREGRSKSQWMTCSVVKHMQSCPTTCSQTQKGTCPRMTWTAFSGALSLECWLAESSTPTAFHCPKWMLLPMSQPQDRYQWYQK